MSASHVYSPTSIQMHTAAESERKSSSGLIPVSAFAASASSVGLFDPHSVQSVQNFRRSRVPENSIVR